MSGIPSPVEQMTEDSMLDVNEDLEGMTEEVEELAVQLTWMAYEMVALRTKPELAASMQELQETYERCTAAVCGGDSSLEAEDMDDNNNNNNNYPETDPPTTPPPM